MEHVNEIIEIKGEMVKLIDEFCSNLMSKKIFELEMEEVIRKVCGIKDRLNKA